MKKRPLSPHLTIYKPHITMVMSIFHRITGFGIYFGALLLVAWLYFIAEGADSFAWFASLFDNPFMQLILFCFFWAFFHHLIGGVKHLVQDTGAWLGKTQVTTLGFLHTPLSLAITLLFIFFTYGANL